MKPEEQTTDEWLADYGREPQLSPVPTAAPVKTVDAENDDCDFDFRALVPDGEYTVRYLEYCTVTYKGDGKIRMKFAIIESEYQGTPIEGFRNVKLRGPAGKNGKFSVTAMSKFLREFATVFSDRKHLRKDRVSPNAFKDIDLRAVAKEVGKDGQGYKIPQSLRYSVIDRILGRKKEQ